MHLEARRPGESVVRRSKLHLVDLAGSKRVGRTGIDGTILTEAKYINASLHFLEQVIIALQVCTSAHYRHLESLLHATTCPTKTYHASVCLRTVTGVQVLVSPQCKNHHRPGRAGALNGHLAASRALPQQPHDNGATGLTGWQLQDVHDCQYLHRAGMFLQPEQ